MEVLKVVATAVLVLCLMTCCALAGGFLAEHLLVTRVPATSVPCQCQKRNDKSAERYAMVAKSQAGECLCCPGDDPDLGCNCESVTTSFVNGVAQVPCVCEQAKKRELAKCEAKCCEVGK